MQRAAQKRRKSSKKHTKNSAAQAKKTRSENVVMMHNLPLVWIIFSCGYLADCIIRTFYSNYLCLSFCQTIKKDQCLFMAFTFFLAYFRVSLIKIRIRISIWRWPSVKCRIVAISKDSFKVFIEATAPGLWFRGCRVNFQHLLSADEII